MLKFRSVYDSKGKAYEITDGEITWVREDLQERGITTERSVSGQVIMDIEPFKSPIDGTIIKSRNDLRDHCKRHNVVPTGDLKGLPPQTLEMPHVPSRRETELRKHIIGEIMSHKRYFEGR